MKKILTLLIIITLNCKLSFCQLIKNTIYSGIITLDDGTPLLFEIDIKEKNGIVNGTSITGKGTPDETTSEITGTYNKKDKSYILKESQIISTNSEAELSSFCYIHMNIKQVGNMLSSRIEGDFTGYFLDGKKCANGNIFLMKNEKLEKIKKKINKKINKKISSEKEKNQIFNTKILSDDEDMSINWSSDNIIIYIWDANKIDGDKINLKINEKMVLKDFKTKKKRKKIKYQLKKGENIIKLTATNLGLHPPNTSRIELIDGNTKYPVITQLRENKSAIIKILK